MPRLRAYDGPALLSYGFRPFFLLGSIYAGLAVLVWLPVFYGELSLHSAFAPRDWHVHEMLYGYLPAVITGFLFTAIPNWTGQLPIQGKPLLALVLVWVAGRVVVTISADVGWLPAAAIDVSFLALIVAAAAREILAGKNWRNLKVVAAGRVAAHRKRRIPSRGSFQRYGGLRHSGRHRGRGAADRPDRRPDHSEFHAQLAGSQKSRTAAFALRSPSTWQSSR